MSHELVAPTVLCTHDTPSQQSWQAEMTAYWIEFRFDLASSNGGNYRVCSGIYLTTHTQTTLPIVRHFGFPVAILQFNLQLSQRENLKFCAEFLEEIRYCKVCMIFILFFMTDKLMHTGEWGRVLRNWITIPNYGDRLNCLEYWSHLCMFAIGYLTSTFGFANTLFVHLVGMV